MWKDVGEGELCKLVLYFLSECDEDLLCAYVAARRVHRTPRKSNAKRTQRNGGDVPERSESGLSLLNFAAKRAAAAAAATSAPYDQATVRDAQRKLIELVVRLPRNSYFLHQHLKRLSSRESKRFLEFLCTELLEHCRATLETDASTKV